MSAPMSGPASPERERLAQAIFTRLAEVAAGLEETHVSVLAASIGLATGRNGQALYRLGLTEVARVAADVALAHPAHPGAGR